MITASCHCGAVRYTVEKAPEMVLDCNCSHCRLYGGLWAYYPQRDVKFEAPPNNVHLHVGRPRVGVSPLPDVRLLHAFHCGGQN